MQSLAFGRLLLSIPQHGVRGRRRVGCISRMATERLGDRESIRAFPFFRCDVMTGSPLSMVARRRVHPEFAVLLTISLTWLHTTAAADRAISIPVQITDAQNYDPFPSYRKKCRLRINVCTRGNMIAGLTMFRSDQPVTVKGAHA